MTLPTLPPLADSSQLVDAGNLAALKQAAAKNSPQALRAAAKQFESLFVSMVLKSMQQANFKDPLFGSDQGDLYQEMYDDQMAGEITKGKGLGLADMLVQQLAREGADGASPSSSAQPASGTARAAIGRSTTSSSATANAASATVATASTHTAASDRSPTACATSAQQASFARALWPDAQQAARQLGVSPVTLLAQAALETDWGRNMPQDARGGASNNLFGIKATPAWGGAAVESSTLEYSGGTASAVKAQFRSYGSTSRCFQDYVALLSDNPRYAAALGTGSDVQAFGTALQQGGYATDPAYASKLSAVAGTLTHALKFAADQPTTAGSGTLQRR
ncbi:MAG TPA: flagellar assembly peptidoglycan hydrolase FlgJ [Steroidobacteraceae bacterium]|nr:flagellar assembly peptidoglycan hydrolase FlgJ [Steroidobacteraceae bacterium]